MTLHRYPKDLHLQEEVIKESTFRTHIYGMDKEDVVHIYTMGYYSAIKKYEIMPLAATWMDLGIIILSEVSQTEKDKYHMVSFTGGI